MDAIGGPQRRRRDLRGHIEHTLKWDEHGASLISHPLRRGAITVERRKPFIVHMTCPQPKRLADDKFHLWQCRLRALDECLIIDLVFFERAVVFAVERMPKIVHTNK